MACNSLYHTHCQPLFPFILHGTDKKPDSKKAKYQGVRFMGSLAWRESELLLLTGEASELFGKVSVSEQNRISKIYISARGL